MSFDILFLRLKEGRRKFRNILKWLFLFFVEYRKAFSGKFLLFLLLLCCRQIRGQQILQLYYNVPFVFANVRKFQALFILTVLSEESKFTPQDNISNIIDEKCCVCEGFFFISFFIKTFLVYITVTSIEVKH